MAERITELYIMLESRMKTLYESKNISESFYKGFVSVCKAHNKCIQEQSVFHSFMTGIKPEDVTEVKELPENLLKILRKSYPVIDETGISGADLTGLIMCAYNSCCQYGKSLANRLSQLYSRAALSDKRLAEILEDFEEAMKEMHKE